MVLAHKAVLDAAVEHITPILVHDRSVIIIGTSHTHYASTLAGSQLRNRVSLPNGYGPHISDTGLYKKVVLTTEVPHVKVSVSVQVPSRMLCKLNGSQFMPMVPGSS